MVCYGVARLAQALNGPDWIRLARIGQAWVFLTKRILHLPIGLLNGRLALS